jgi:hypothetical protein
MEAGLRLNRRGFPTRLHRQTGKRREKKRGKKDKEVDM